MKKFIAIAAIALMCMPAFEVGYLTSVGHYKGCEKYVLPPK
jgi:hypothetical protein